MKADMLRLLYGIRMLHFPDISVLSKCLKIHLLVIARTVAAVMGGSDSPKGCEWPAESPAEPPGDSQLHRPGGQAAEGPAGLWWGGGTAESQSHWRGELKGLA